MTLLSGILPTNSTIYSDEKVYANVTAIGFSEYSNAKVYANVADIGYAELDSSPTFTGNVAASYFTGDGSALTGILPGAPRVTAVTYTGGDLAVLPAGGDTVIVTGTGFQNGCTVFINNTQVPTVTFTSSTSISFTTPALTAGNYIFYVVNPDGGTGIAVPGLAVSGTPTWTTSAGNLDNTTEDSYSVTINAYSDSNITYSIFSGALPAGLSLNANTGVISGTVESAVANLTSNTSYNFAVAATDEELQNVERSFTITYVPTYPTWYSPNVGALDTNGIIDQTYTANLNAISNSEVTYTIPSGNIADGNITISGSTLTGTPFEANTYYFTIRATDAEGHYTDREFSLTIDVDIYEISRSLRFNSAAAPYLTRTPGSAGSLTTWTWSAWVKLGKLTRGSDSYMLISTDGVTATDVIGWGGSNLDQLIFYVYNDGYKGQLRTSALYRDPGAWCHVVAVWDTTNATNTDRIRLYFNGVRLTNFQSTTYPSENQTCGRINTTAPELIGYSSVNETFDGYMAEVRFIDGQALDASYFGEFNSTTGVWTPIAYSGSYGTNGYYLNFADNTNTTTIGYDAAGSNNWTANKINVPGGKYPYSTTLTTTTSWSDPPSGAFDGSLATGAAASQGGETNTWDASPYNITVNSSLRVYAYGGGSSWSVNGVGQSSLNTAGWFTASGLSLPYTLTQIQVNCPGSTGEFLKAIEVDGTLLIDSFAGDDLTDTPTRYGEDTGTGGEVRGNYCTMNPLDYAGNLNNGNLDYYTTNNAWTTARGTVGVSSGKWYWETTLISGTNYMTGIATSKGGLWYLGAYDGGYGYSGGDAGGGVGQLYYNTSAINFGTAYNAGDVIGVALDLDNSTLQFYKNNVAQTLITDIAEGTGGPKGTWFPALSVYAGSGTTKWSCNFGQRPFTYAAPSGFKALCTTNFDAPAIDQGDSAFKVVTYTGNSVDGRQITGVGFQPDLVWVKSRSGAYYHQLTDSVRGVGKSLFSNATDAEDSSNGGGSISSFDADGFTIANGTVNNNYFNASGQTYVAWCWKAGGSGVSNTDGSITSTVSANPTAGISVVTYTGNNTGGATVGHGLGKAPSVVIIKNRGAGSTSWLTLHTSAGFTGDTSYGFAEYYMMLLDSTGSRQNYSQDLIMGPTSTTFALGVSGSGYSNSNGSNYVAYCFAPVEGFSAFGSYTGNGSADGTFVYTGFKPAFVITKRTNTTGNWVLKDSTRNPYNIATYHVYPNLSNAEESGAGAYVDILSNGFKLRGTYADMNASGGNFIYMAFAENPFKYSLTR